MQNSRSGQKCFSEFSSHFYQHFLPPWLFPCPLPLYKMIMVDLCFSSKYPYYLRFVSISVVFYLPIVLWLKLRALHVLSKCLATKQALYFFFSVYLAICQLTQLIFVLQAPLIPSPHIQNLRLLSSPYPTNNSHISSLLSSSMINDKATF